MIFCIDNYSKPKEIVVYDSIDQITNMIEWQDILDKGIINIDADGNIYEWDDYKKSEYGRIYGYSMKVVGTNTDLANKCFLTYEKQNRPTEFLLEE
ncbi:MAG TPA: hypothetical protein VF465_23380 [Flavobacterium sp.]|uniref:hypothetical protein n=1 Tax=Flavobacterium sp. TaxID=239 RepID=UPI002ED2EEC2